MYRCAVKLVAGALAALAVAAPALAQVRPFPPNTLRGTVVFGGFPEIQLNGQSATLAPGSRIRDQTNRTVLPATLFGNKYTVHYTVGLNQSQVQDVWLLRPEEASIRPWPRTLDEAHTWTWDATALTWTKP